MIHRTHRIGIGTEALMSAGLALGVALCVPAQIVSRIDTLLVTFISILVAAAIPGIALTVSAQRPPVSSPLEANRLGASLLRQARFWFGFIATGGFAVAVLILGGALSWSLPVPPRPTFIAWTPGGGAWLVGAAAFALAFFLIRSRHLIGAVESLIELGTKAHAEATAAAEARLQSEVAKQIASMPSPPDRGLEVTERPRH